MLAEWYETPERRELRSTVCRFVEKEVAPKMSEWEVVGEVPRSVHSIAGELGLLGIGFPDSVGGSGGDLLDKVIMWEELLEAGSSIGFLVSLLTLDIAVPHIAAVGTPDQINKWVKPTLAGSFIGSLGVSEPGAGSDVASMRTTAVREGDFYRVNGSKIFITSGCRADFVTTAVRTGGAGAHGVSLLVIEKGTPGFSIGRKLDKMGWRCSDTAELFFENAMVPAANLIGEENSGFGQLMNHFQDERIMLAVAAYSAAQRSLDLTVRWVRDREAFGKNLVSNQVVSHQLVQMRQQIELARTYTREVAAQLNHGRSVEAEVSMAKNASSAALTYVAEQAVRLHGGLGYMRDSEVERHYRDAPAIAVGGGAVEVLAELAARRLGYTADQR